MLSDLDETIRQILIAELPITDGEIDIAFEQPKREWSARLSRPTLNLFLYDIRENVELRQYGYPQVSNGDNTVVRKRTPLRVDCLYMLTAWANEPSDEHRLLMNTMMTLFRLNPLPADRLIGRLQDQAFKIPAKLASHDKLTNVAEIWSALDNEIRPSVSYLVTLTVDPWIPFEDPMARTISLRTNRTDGEDGSAPVSEAVAIAGTVMRDNEPVAGVRLRVKDRGLRTVSDRFGRFQLAGLTSGEHTLLVQPTTTTTIEHTITIPQDNYDIEL